jgi:hypothetical protein
LLVPHLTLGEGVMGSELAGLRYHELKTSLDEPFVVPETFSRAELVARLRQLVEAAVEDEEVSGEDPTDEFRAALTREFGPDSAKAVATDEETWQDELTVATYLLGQIRTLAHDARDHVWAGIIENAFAPLFAGRFSTVVGNPPWLTWTKLPERWRQESEVVWKRYGLWKVPVEDGARDSLASTDLAILVFAVALERYASQDGWVGLLTPDSIISADPGGRAFRRFRLKSEHGLPDREQVNLPFSIVHIDHWARVQPFSPDAANKPIFAVARPSMHHEFPVPGSRWERATSGASLSGTWSHVRQSLVGRSGEFRAIDPARPTSAWSFQRNDTAALISGGFNDWPFGKGLDTRGANGIYFVRLLSVDVPRGVATIVNLPNESRNPRPAEARGQVEAELLYPLLRGKDVQAWIASPSSYMVLPHDPASLGDVLTDEQLSEEYPKARRWLRRFHGRLKGRKTPPTRSWKMNGKDWCRVDGPLAYMAGEHIVVVREISERPAAAVVEARMDYDLGRRTAPLIDHKLVFCSVESREEALYLAAFINSTPIQDLLDSYINAVAVGPTTLSRLPIPPFDPEHEDTKDLVKLADEVVRANEPSVAASERQAVMDALVLSLVGRDAAEHEQQPRRQRSTPRRRQVDLPAEGEASLF